MVTHGVVTHGVVTHGVVTHGAVTHGAVTHGVVTHGVVAGAVVGISRKCREVAGGIKEYRWVARHPRNTSRHVQ